MFTLGMVLWLLIVKSLGRSSLSVSGTDLSYILERHVERYS